MNENQHPPTRYQYQAQTYTGKTVTGSLDAPDHAEAQATLQTLGLRTLNIEPDVAPKLRRISGDDFIAFNQQLAHLTAAGMPIERGLRLIAGDMRSGRLRKTVQTIADDMEGGKSLSEAFDAHKQQFPRLYGSLVEAGVQSGRLPGMLLNLGRHLELVRQLKRELWRSLSYPAIIFMTLVVIIFGISVFILPKFELIFEDFDMDLPGITKGILALSQVLPEVLGTVMVFLGAAAVLWWLSSRVPVLRVIVEQINLIIPIVGDVIQRNLLARWCDALRLGVEAGVDLPRAVMMSTEAIDSPALRKDGEKIAKNLAEGKSISDTPGLKTVLPTVTTSIDLAAAQSNLGPMLASLSEMYRHEAEVRLSTLHAVVTPVSLVVIGMTLGMVVLALLLPLVKLMTWLT